MENMLNEAGQHLEEMFFAKQEAERLQKIRDQIAREKALDGLANATGVQDKDVLKSLHDTGINGESILALTMIPLIAVAWADADLDENERRKILEHMESSGVESGGPAHAMLLSWMEEPPPAKMMDVWSEYIRALVKSLDPAATAKLRKSILEQARGVAESSGGFLGVKKVSGVEKSVLDRLEQAFSG
jgi:hypothetical protein